MLVIQSQTAPPKIELDQDLMTPELQKYLNRNYWEQKQKDSSAPAVGQPPAVQQQQPQATDMSGSKLGTSVTTPSAPPPTQSEPSYSSINSYTEIEVCS